MTDPTRSVLLLMGSVRAGRRCPEIAAWVAELAAGAGLACEIVDLRDWPLPADDEPGIPARDGYANEHTRRWSRTIAAAAGFVIVTPQYNWGYPAPLKNAIDHLYAEWRGKPVAIVSYGGHGGGKCAAQLREVCDGLKMAPVPTMPALTIGHDIMAGGAIDPARDFADAAPAVQAALAELAAALSPPR